jgi:hypothetical protein
MTSTRALLISSWHSATRRADREGALILNAASFAGYVLERGGTVEAARCLLPLESSSPFWARVRSYLDDVSNETPAGNRVTTPPAAVQP